jgi:hypothetical protein
MRSTADTASNIPVKKLVLSNYDIGETLGTGIYV